MTAFAAALAKCKHCDDTGWVCEAHPDLPSDCVSTGQNACHCGAPGMPCRHCELGVGRPPMGPDFVADVIAPLPPRRRH